MNCDRIQETKRRWALEASSSDLGLWWIADDVRELAGDNVDECGVREQTLELLRPLLQNATLQAVDLLPGGRFRPWVGDVDAQLSRIDTEWRALGCQPNLGDIVWFIGNPS
jgi:hypothetical protein